MALTSAPASIPALVLQRAAAEGAATILRKKDRGIWKSVPWSELAARMRQAGIGLRAAGLRPGEVAGVLAETRPEWVTAELGILSAGAASLGIPPDGDAEQVAALLRESGCAVLFVENEEQLDKALMARERCPALRHIVIFDMVGLRDFTDPNCESLAGLLERGARLEAAERSAWEQGVAAVGEQQPALACGGAAAEGAAPGGMLTHGDVLRRVAEAGARLAARRGDERLALLPMHDPIERVFGLHYALDAGIVSNFLENPDTAMENLQEVQPTVLGADAAIWGRLRERISAAAAAATPVQRMLYRAALAAAARGGAAAWLARALVLRPVRREAGLARLRLAYGGALPPDLGGWLAALGIQVTPLDGATAAMPAANRRYGAVRVEA